MTNIVTNIVLMCKSLWHPCETMHKEDEWWSTSSEISFTRISVNGAQILFCQTMLMQQIISVLLDTSQTDVHHWLAEYGWLCTDTDPVQIRPPPSLCLFSFILSGSAMNFARMELMVAETGPVSLMRGFCEVPAQSWSPQHWEWGEIKGDRAAEVKIDL